MPFCNYIESLKADIFYFMKHTPLSVSLHVCDWNAARRLFCREFMLCSVNANAKLFVKTAEPINQLRSVKISSCVEASVWAQEEGDNQSSMSLPVFFLIPQDLPVSAPAPSLHPLSFSLFIALSVCLLSKIPLTINPPHLLSFPSWLPLSTSPSLLFLLQSSILPPGLSCLRLVSFSFSGGWRRVSPSRLAPGCCGNNSCHFVVHKVTEEREETTEWKRAKHKQTRC